MGSYRREKGHSMSYRGGFPRIYPSSSYTYKYELFVLCTWSTFFGTILCRFYAWLRRETSRNFLITRFMEEMSHVFRFALFYTAAYFHLGGRQHFSFSHCPSKIFMFFFQQNWLPSGLSLALALALLSASRYTLKFSRKKDSGGGDPHSVLFFFCS